MLTVEVIGRATAVAAASVNSFVLLISASWPRAWTSRTRIWSMWMPWASKVP